MAEPNDASYMAADLIIDVGQQRVTRAGNDIALPNLSFRFLLALLRAAPNVLDNDAAMAQVWPGLVISPETINKRVNLLREALGDDAREPRYIVGVRSRGYRWIAAVSRRVPAAPARDLTAQPPGANNAGPAPAGPDVPIEIESIEPPQLPVLARTWVRILVFALTLVVLVIIGARWIGHRASIADQPTDAEPSSTVAGSVSARTVAVLPFESMSADPADAYLAQGLPEMILDRMSRIRGLSVISRNSSFALPTKGIDSRAIGRRLHAGLLIAGSVQRQAERLRVAVQLVDASTGTQVWSANLDRGLHDIFSIEDEIAEQLANALSTRLGETKSGYVPNPTGPPIARPTKNFDAYLEFLQAGALLGTWRLADMQAGATRAAKAIELDPNFARAYVMLARATTRSAEFEITTDRPRRMDIAEQQAQRWLQKALALDPNDSGAYVERAYLIALHDTEAAEKDYRRALELNPNDADAYEGLATILADDPARRGAAMMAIDQARKLNPLEPRLDVTKATLLFYWLGDADSAVELLTSSLTRHPLFEPALIRLEEIRWATGHPAEAVNLGEQVLSQDSRSAQARQFLVLAYLEMDELRAAQSVAPDNDRGDANLGLGTQLYTHNVQAAADLAYAAAASNTLSGAMEPVGVDAIRTAARHHGQLARAAALFTQRGRIQWDSSGRLTQGDQTGLQINAVSLGDMLMQQGDTARARTILEAGLAAMDHDERVNQRNELWYFLMRPLALGLLGRREEAIAVMVKRATAHAGTSGDWYFYSDPALAALQNDPRVIALRAQSRAQAQSERTALQQLRARGLVPRRG